MRPLLLPRSHTHAHTHDYCAHTNVHIIRGEPLILTNDVVELGEFGCGLKIPIGAFGPGHTKLEAKQKAHKGKQKALDSFC